LGARRPQRDQSEVCSLSSSPAAPPGKNGESLRQKAVIAVMGFVLTGIVGTMITSWIQQRGWAWQNRIARIDKDTQNALGAYQSVSDLVNARWHATYGMVRAIERGASVDEWKAARDEFAASDKDWAIRYTSVARDIAFYVDTPFGIEAKDKLALVWPLPCTKYALGAAGGAGLDAASARVVLEVINHCSGLVKDEIDKAIDAGGPAKLDPAARKAMADAAYPKLDALYKTNETLRCVIFARSLAIRQSTMADSYWGSFFGLAQQNYAAPNDTKDCTT
jgi:hypothetical protein